MQKYDEDNKKAAYKFTNSVFAITFLKKRKS